MFAASEACVSRRLHGGWRTVFLGRSVDKEKVTALASQCVTICWNKSTGMRLPSDFVFPWSDQECLQVCPEKLTRLLSFRSPCARCSWVIILLWLLGVCLFKENREQWRLLFPLVCPSFLRQGGRGSCVLFLQRHKWRGGCVACHFLKSVINVRVPQNIAQSQILKLILSYIVLGFGLWHNIPQPSEKKIFFFNV